MNDDPREITSLHELETHFKELLDQYIVLKSNAQFGRTIKETFSLSSEGSQNSIITTSNRDSAHADKSHELEYSLADVSHLEISKEAHYEDLLEDLQIKLKSENEKLDKLNAELNDIIISINKKDYNSKTRNINESEKDYMAIDSELARLACEHSEQKYLQELKKLLSFRLHESEIKRDELDARLRKVNDTPEDLHKGSERSSKTEGIAHMARLESLQELSKRL